MLHSNCEPPSCFTTIDGGNFMRNLQNRVKKSENLAISDFAKKIVTYMVFFDADQ